MWIILDKQKNSFGDLIVTFANTKTGKRHESTFSEGEHGQVPHYLEALNDET
jgi:hypothetical protein